MVILMLNHGVIYLIGGFKMYFLNLQPYLDVMASN